MFQVWSKSIEGLTKLGTYLVLRRVWNLLIFKVIGQGHWVNFLPCNILVNTRINILQWILTKLGTYIVKFGQNPLKDVDPRVFTRMLHSKHLTR
jgi:hypothetical protein